jgi:uncharacterized protein (UPF0332 family)
VNPESNLELAQVLVRPPRDAPEEASFRAACGRAYYAAFAVARDLLVSARIRITPDGSAHEVVSRLLRESAHEDIRAAGVELHELRRTRNSADYDVGPHSPARRGFDRPRSQLVVASASVIVNTIKKAAASDPRLGIADWIG